MSGTTQKNRLTCGEFGGRNVRGEPCGVSAVDGPCRLHLDQETVVEQGAHDELAEAAEKDFRLAVERGIINDFPHVTPPFGRIRDKVAIVGFTDHRTEALKLDPEEWELWGLNELYRYMPVERFSRWFEIHGREYLEKDEDGRKHTDDLKALQIPIFMQQVHADIPASVRFPVEEMCEALDSEYWTNCPAYMIGFAILLGYKEIAIYGVDMAQDTEYQIQRPNCEFWLGVAKGKGIKTSVPPTSDLLKCIGLYGYEGSGSVLARKLKSRLEWLHAQDNERLGLMRRLDAEYDTKRDEIMSQLDRARGALEETVVQRQTPKRVERREFLEARVAEGNELVGKLDAEYKDKAQALRDERNQMVGGIQDVTYILRSWLVQPEATEGGGNIPSHATRAADPRTGIEVPSENGETPTAPSVVPAAAG